MTAPGSTTEPLRQNLAAVQAELPPPPQAIGSYVPVVQVGNLLYTSGILPMKDGEVAYTGAVGGWNAPVEHAQKAARLAAMNALSAVSHFLGGLDRVKRIVKVTGFISSAPGFFEQPAVMNSASDYLVDVFGDAGKHVRSAVGVLALPKDASVEIELVVEIQP